MSDPSRFDVILTDNLFGDILTDEAGAVVGGVGYSASGCINASNEYPSMFEPIHGSAPDIAGQGKANPTAAILSAAMLLRHLGFDDAAARIDTAVEADIEELAPPFAPPIRSARIFSLACTRRWREPPQSRFARQPPAGAYISVPLRAVEQSETSCIGV